jgi:hypothetical protein
MTYASQFLSKVPTANLQPPQCRRDFCAYCWFHERTDMAPAVQRYFEAGLAPSTKKRYRAATRRFHQSCTRYTATTPLPVTEHLLCCFVAYLADDGLATQSFIPVRGAEHATSTWAPRPAGAVMLKRVWKDTSCQVHLPITLCILSRVSEHLQSCRTGHGQSGCPGSLLRLGELLPVSTAAYDPTTSLSRGDVVVDSRANPYFISASPNATPLGWGWM